MLLSRRSWLKLATSGLVVSELVNAAEVKAAAASAKLKGAKEVFTACNFCACGCGIVAHVRDGKLVHMEGDADHAVNQGALCSKGAAMLPTHESPQRVTAPLYRAPGASEWQTISWDEALDKLAQKLKAARDASFAATEKVGDAEVPVNRTEAIGLLGGAQNTNEECYLFNKLGRLLGTNYVEHQARLCHGPSVPSLGATFGRGAMTNHWSDLQNAKVFLIEGSNAAENHAMSMRWIQKAKDQGAIVIHVDPRFNRTSSVADIYARIRPGTDIAFLGAVINHVLTRKLYDDAYVKLHTNALLLTRDEFDFQDGFFSGYDQEKRKYDTASWDYRLDKDRKPVKAQGLEEPGTVFSRLKGHFARYTPAMASDITGIPTAEIERIAETFAANKPGTILYALGMTQHTVGIQNIRCYAILQLLLGNIGKPGGGINALRGEPNVQGACDMSVLNHTMFGYLASPTQDQPNLRAWTKANGTFRAKFLVNGLKAWFGENATPENDFGFNWLPKRSGAKDYSLYGLIDAAWAGKLQALWVMGQNPMVTNPNLNYVGEALGKLELLVVQELWQTETACFWQRPGVDPKTVKTEVLLLPAAFFMEKEGTITGSGRLVQWRYAAVRPPGQAKDDLEIIDEVFRRVRKLYQGSTDPKDAPIVRANWDYPAEGRAEAVLQEISGRALRDVPDKGLKAGDLVKGIGALQADGSTSSGVWVYAGVFGGGKNLTKRRDSKADPSGLGLYSGFAWTWPGNIKILYNRASCDATGKPWPGTTPLVWWDAEQKKWTGHDIPDVSVATDGPDTPNGQRAFRMVGEGLGRLFAAAHKDPDPKDPELPRDGAYVPKDGPLPEHYEPVESPVANAMHPGAQVNPALKYPRVKEKQPIGTTKDFPYVLMTSSISEHWCGGGVTRNVPWLNEIVPEPVVELPPQLAEKLSVKSGDAVKVASARGEVTVKAMVTPRMQPLRIAGKEVFTIWMPYNWGFKGLSQGPSTNVLTMDAGDPGAGTQETKACLVNVSKVHTVVASTGSKP
jgi:formate dehydrogenase major subunit